MCRDEVGGLSHHCTIIAHLLRIEGKYARNSLAVMAICAVRLDALLATNKSVCGTSQSVHLYTVGSKLYYNTVYDSSKILFNHDVVFAISSTSDYIAL